MKHAILVTKYRWILIEMIKTYLRKCPAQAHEHQDLQHSPHDRNASDVPKLVEWELEPQREEKEHEPELGERLNLQCLGIGFLI